jgi:hypothetical protein
LSNGTSYPPSPGKPFRTRPVSEPAQIRILRRHMLSYMPVLWIVWAVVFATLLALLAYRGTLTRYEEDQLFLDPAEDHQKSEQVAILQRIDKIQPFVRIMIGATCVMSACVLGVYVWDAIRHLG